MNDITIFIKTYSFDFTRLIFLLHSIDKYMTNFKQIVICVEECDKEQFNNRVIIPSRLKPITKIHLIPTSSINGYIYQQEIKLRCSEWVDTKYVLFIDSDCFIKDYVNCNEEFFRDWKPILFKREWDINRFDICWKHPTDVCLRTDTKWETMCCMPFIYLTETLKKINDVYDWKNYFKNVNTFSEFNVIGNWIILNEIENYYVLDFDIWGNIYNKFLKQYSSYIEINNDIWDYLNVLFTVKPMDYVILKEDWTDFYKVKETGEAVKFMNTIIYINNWVDFVNKIGLIIDNVRNGTFDKGRSCILYVWNKKKDPMIYKALNTMGFNVISEWGNTLYFIKVD